MCKNNKQGNSVDLIKLAQFVEKYESDPKFREHVNQITSESELRADALNQKPKVGRGDLSPSPLPQIQTG
jgi:hypothetical protein